MSSRAGALATFDASLEPGVLTRAHVRVVFDLDELRERLAIWDAGLDDSIIECVKLQCLGERPAMRGPRDRIRLMTASSDTLTFHVIGAGAPEIVHAEFDVSRATVEAIAADPAWQAKFPALFEHGFVSIDRYLLLLR